MAAKKPVEPLKRGPGRPTNASKGLPTVRPRESVRKTEVAAPVMAPQVRYDAGGSGRRMAGWNPPTSGPNSTKGTINKAVERTRDSLRNDWAPNSLSQKWSTTLIGIGITPRFKRIKSVARRQQITDLWNDFMATCDANGASHGYALQTLAVATQTGDGEVFLRFRRRDTTLPLPVPLQLQLLERDQCPDTLTTDSFQGLPNGHRIVQGVEFNRFGRITAYWFFKEHPGDAPLMMSAIDPTGMVRVAASEVRHVYKPKRPGEVRGVSAFLPLLMKLRDSADMEDATLLRQKLANLFVGVLIKEANAAGLQNRDPLSGAPITTSAASEPLLPLSPGIVQELNAGEKMEFSNPPEAGVTYSDYMRTNYLGVASGFGMPYELFSGDIQNISDRSLRIVINEMRRYAEQEQWQLWIPKFCQPIVEEFAAAAALVGKLTLEEAELLKRCEHAPHGWAHIHPVQDPQGKQMEVEAGFRSRSSVIAERGDDPDTVDAERAADQKREKALGLEQEPAAQTTNQPKPNQTEGQRNEEQEE